MNNQSINWKDPLYLHSFLTEEERKISATAKEFCEKHLFNRVKSDNNNKNFDKNLFKEFGRLGFLGPTIEGYGCANVSNISYGLIAKEFEAVDSGYRSAISVQSSLVMHPIYNFGSEEQKKRYIPKLSKGDLIGCFGLTESEAGSDPSSIKTKLIKDGKNYRLNGSKNWITNAPIADIFIIWAKDEDNSIVGIIVEKEDKGISTSLIDNKLSLLLSPTGQIYMQDIIIPENRILQLTKGWKSVFSCLNKARYGIAWGVMGAAEFIWHQSKEYVENRIMFKKQLAGNQLIQKKLADMQTEITIGLNACYQLGKLIDLNKEVNIGISMLKRNNCKKAIEIAREARDMLGANGLTEDYHIMRHLINLETVKTYEGTEDIHALILGKYQTGISAF
ncbi:MAG: Acyl-CoA dehydrogenase [Alphaproteobacteria bacterium MarineAlpha5_Bin11]|nr:acyl-CoA dehydrogenase [Pelagibacteraceae bacterium]PPR42750.1 MAG: Acyl-CoA dehydrogenase [Alphaproteobacteria bacterium MarineAlpha5_Bin11]|tara:strand:+ start:2515 stop:3687 length:1173 start_codon:yes stop_codon:yes gene_type:complete